MTLANDQNRQSAKRAARISGICAAARDLHVSRQHIWAVLNKRRESKPLVARFRAWRHQQSVASKTTSVPSPKAKTNTSK